MGWLTRWRHSSPEPSVPQETLVPPAWDDLIENSSRADAVLQGDFEQRPIRIRGLEGRLEIALACEADLWCRLRTSVTTMLDPSLFEIYTTGDDRLDEEWIIQTNPPSAFRVTETTGCEMLLNLLALDPTLHATKGWLVFRPLAFQEVTAFQERLSALGHVRRTAERELIVPTLL